MSPEEQAHRRIARFQAAIIVGLVILAIVFGVMVAF